MGHSTQARRTYRNHIQRLSPCPFFPFVLLHSTTIITITNVPCSRSCTCAWWAPRTPPCRRCRLFFFVRGLFGEGGGQSECGVAGARCVIGRSFPLEHHTSKPNHHQPMPLSKHSTHTLWALGKGAAGRVRHTASTQRGLGPTPLALPFSVHPIHTHSSPSTHP